MKIGLGTVQFGLPYGISNTRGQPSFSEVESIFALARTQGIHVFDTAPGYGQAEEVLGRCLVGYTSPRVVTKVEKVGLSGALEERLASADRAFDRSLGRLGLSSVDGLLMHDASLLSSSEGDAWNEWLEGKKKTRKTLKIGASIYAPDEGRRLLEKYPLDLIQLPLNLFDQRAVKDGFLKECQRAGVEIHVRSVFLQGLLLLEPQKIPLDLLEAVPYVQRLRDISRKSGRSVFELAIGFVRDLEAVDHVLFGVNRAEELSQILEGWKGTAALSGDIDFESLACSDKRVINPSLWRGNA